MNNWYAQLAAQYPGLSPVQKALVIDKQTCRLYNNQLIRQESIDLEKFYMVMSTTLADYQIAGGHEFNDFISSQQDRLYDESVQQTFLDVLISLAHLSPKSLADDSLKMRIFIRYLRVFRPKVHEAVEGIILKVSNPLATVVS